MARAGSASSASNHLIQLNDFSFACLPYRSDHRKIYRTKNLKVLPKRMTDAPEELIQLIESVHHVLIDATERPIQRPKKPARQKKYYRGKKGGHTVKNTTVSDIDKRILILGETVPGSQHDYSILKEELDPKTDGFASTEASVDLGYQGIKKDYSSAEHIHIPYKKPRKSKKNPDPN
jgi:hypothetical protein